MATAGASDGRQDQLEALAAIAVTAAEMGGTQQEILDAVGQFMLRFGMVTAADVRDIIGAVLALPEPLDEPADVRERKRPIEEMLGVTSPEVQLTAVMSAVEALRGLAERLQAHEDT